MEATSVSELDLLREEVARLKARLELYENRERRELGQHASIQDLIAADAVLESITDAFFGLDEHWRFAYLNREAERLLGRTREDLTGKTIWTEYAAAIGTKFDVEYHRARAENTTVHFEEYYEPLRSWYDVTAYPLANGLAVFFREINERKQAERDMQAREQELRTILDNVPVIVSNIDRDGRFRALNKRYEETFGRGAEWAIGRTLAEVAGEPHVSIAKPHLERALRDGVSVTFDSMIRNRDGNLRDIQVFYAPRRDPEGRPDGLIAMVEDITEQKRAESAVREREALFRSFFNLAAAGMALGDPASGRFLEVNDTLAGYLGYSKDELLGQSLIEVSHSADAESSTNALSELMAGKTGSAQLENRYVRKDGSVLWAQSSVSLVRSDEGTPLYWVAVVVDITERKLTEQVLRESEHRLRVMAESLPQLVWTALPDGNCDYLSRQWVEYTGIPEQEQLGFRWLDLVMHSEDRDHTMRAWMAAVADEAQYDLEYRLRRHDGAYRWFKTRGTPVRDTSGRIVRWFGTCTDIDEQRRAEEERLRSQAALERSNLELKQANADLEQFAYAAAHDLQEPLRMVTSYTQLLERALKDRLDGRTREFMQYVVGGARRMGLLLQDLLAYTETSRATDAEERVELDRVLAQALHNLESAIDENAAEISCTPLPVVRGREVHFLQLFQNLIGNAIKYRKPDVAPKIEITSERDAGNWVIRVRDNGMGIEKAYHRQVFGLFKRLHSSEIPGTGMGLAICQRVVERAGGQIWVESELGEGSAFCFTIPATF